MSDPRAALFRLANRRPRAAFLRHGSAGQAIVWFAVMLPLFLAVIGLTIDGGIVLAARRDLQSVADAAARAGAMQIDLRVYRDTAGMTVALDEGNARAIAAAYLAEQQMGLAGTVTTDPQRVSVQVVSAVPLSFLRLVGLETARVAAGASAAARSGITSSGGR